MSEEENADNNANANINGVTIDRVTDTAAAAQEDNLPFSLRCWPCRRFILSMPRTSALLLGVILPLVLLIWISLFFGYFLAQLEGPREMKSNNAIIESRISSSFTKEFTKRMTEELPAICTCTYFRRHQQDIIEKAYEECLAEEELNHTAMIAKANNTQITNSTGNSTTNMSNCIKPRDLTSHTLELFVQETFLNGFSCKNSNQNGNKEHALLEQYEDVTICNNETSFDAFIKPINPNTMMASLNKCGQKARDIVDTYQMSDLVDEDLAASELTFHWIVCSRRSFHANTIFNPFLNYTQHRPAVQEAIVTEVARKSLNDAYCEYTDENIRRTGKNLTVDMRREAIRYSFKKAMEDTNELDQCAVNGLAGGWFWFTIMTTIGYGNTAPETAGGRAMVFIFGFVSILLFAGILANAGSITVALFDGWLERHRLTRGWGQTFVWGALYVLWSLMIASYYLYWNRTRLGNEIGYGDAYWYAYITTTTVGLGDFYLEHVLITGLDFLLWPVLILLGFVLLSSFLNKLVGKIVGYPAPKTEVRFSEAQDSDHLGSDRPSFPNRKNRQSIGSWLKTNSKTGLVH